ncbi:MAG: hypothetical protein BEN18_06895 [Epulopiscium sp. Nuni2H_MBin001]|nr:MAG: hypothetical protein BEN18_06895 [Epulopiscium sp. Nuni2H_MBin001]
MYYFDEITQPLFVTCCFLIVNLINFRYPVFASIKRGSKPEFGEIAYSLTLMILVIISYGSGDLLIGFVGSFIMGYGDGLAAVVGTKFPYGRYQVLGRNKTVSGSSAIFFVSIVVLVIASYLKIYEVNLIKVVIVAALVTAVEAIAIFGLDNIGVPLTAIIGYMWVIQM